MSWACVPDTVSFIRHSGILSRQVRRLINDHLSAAPHLSTNVQATADPGK